MSKRSDPEDPALPKRTTEANAIVQGTLDMLILLAARPVRKPQTTRTTL